MIHLAREDARRSLLACLETSELLIIPITLRMPLLKLMLQTLLMMWVALEFSFIGVIAFGLLIIFACNGDLCTVLLALAGA